MVSFLKIKSLAAKRELDRQVHICVFVYVYVKTYVQQEEITSMRHEVIFQSVQSLGSFFPQKAIYLPREKIVV